MSSIEPARLSDFITDGSSLRNRSDEVPLPVEDHNNWIGQMNTYFEEAGKTEYKVRLNDFTGMTFYGDGSDKSKFEKSIDGRIRRLHEFLAELSAPDSSSVHACSSGAKKDDVFDLKPGIWGISIDLKAAGRRFANWIREKKGNA